MDKRYTLEAAEKLRDSELPILLAWAPGDWFFPIKYAERLAGDARNAKIVQIPDAKTFVPLDQPQRLAGRSRRSSVPHKKPTQHTGSWATHDHFFRPTEAASSDAPTQRTEARCQSRSSTRIAPAARWPSASTKPSPAATNGPYAAPPPKHPRLQPRLRGSRRRADLRRSRRAAAAGEAEAA